MIKIIKKIPFKIIIPIIISLVIIGIVVIPTWRFLDSIHYNLRGYLLSGGLNPGSINFKEHEREFELVVKEIKSFLDDHPDFFKEFDNKCEFENDGIMFYKKGLPYPDNQYFFKVTKEEWSNVKNYKKAYQGNYRHDGTIFIFESYPGYIGFNSSYESSRFLIYTGGGRPNELIDSYWEDYDFVHVKKLAYGWYDIYPTG